MMRDRARDLLTLLFVTVAAVGHAQEADAPFGPEQVRAHYDDLSRDWTAMPDLVSQAFEAAEDRRFRENSAARSTLTSNLTRSYPRADMPRTQSAAAAMAISMALSHDEVLDWVVQTVFLGQGCFGVRDAAEAYFGKPPDALAPEEAAYLAALPMAPHRYHPEREMDRALKRRNFVLSEMVKMGALPAATAEAASQRPLLVRQPLGRCD